MAGGKETPRQKMIGMMYLVLTALLALNVSKEILDAFILVDNGLRKTEQTLDSKNSATWADMEGKRAANPAKAAPFYQAAEDVRNRADDLISYIAELKARTMAVSHSGVDYKYFMTEDSSAVSLDAVNDEGDKYVKKPDENQENTAMLVGSSPNQPKDSSVAWSASELKMKLENFRDYLKQIKFQEVTGKTWSMADQKAIVTSLDSIFKYETVKEDGKDVAWQTKNFYHSPLAAIIPIMTKLQVDVQNAQADVVSALLAGIEGKSYKFTTLEPFVVPQSSYIIKGDTFRAQVLLAAYDATNPPQMWVKQRPWDGEDSTDWSTDDVSQEMQLDINEKGLGELKIPTSSLPTGKHQFKGLISYDGPTGTETFNLYVPEMTVAEASLVVSPTKMNVFYRGVENPVEISVPGVGPEAIEATCPGHRLTKNPDNTYTMRPGDSNTAKISVTAEMPDGTKQNMGTKEFRVKRIPDPVPSFGRKTPYDNTIEKGTMVVQPGVLAEMQNFDFDVDVKVVEFKMVFIRDGQIIEKVSKSNRVTEEMKANMQRTGRGQKFFIEDIKVKMPDGEVRKVANISLKVI
ncbi:type IX secretion system motor protein PorM/GldM [Halocola ammonii]